MPAKVSSPLFTRNSNRNRESKREMNVKVVSHESSQSLRDNMFTAYICSLSSCSMLPHKGERHLSIYHSDCSR